MIKQRNFNSLHDNKGWLIKDRVQSPFNRSNPYRVKGQFFSQKKKDPIIDKNMNNSITHMRQSSHQSNTQSLKYHRNYKQTPPTTTTKTFQSGKLLLLNDNYIMVKNNLLTRSVNSMSQLQQNQYRAKLKHYMQQKFCPSDMYLDIVKDKFMYFRNHNSQFQNTMKMSNLGISRYTGINNSNTSSSSKCTKTPFSTVSYKDRVNPFYRKSLLSAQKDGQLLYSAVHGRSKGEHFFTQLTPTTTLISSVSTYSYSAMSQLPSHGHMSSNVYQIIIPPPSDPKHYAKQRKNSIYSEQSGSGLSNNNAVQNNQYVNSGGLIPSMKELDASFGVEYEWKEKSYVRPFVDAVIQQKLQDPLRIQAMAPKTIRLQGKTFYLNRVNVNR